MQRRLRHGKVLVRAEEHDLRFGGALADFAAQRVPVHHGHFQVGDHQVWVAPRELFERLGAVVAEDGRRISDGRPVDQPGDTFAHVAVVVGDDYGSHHGQCTSFLRIPISGTIISYFAAFCKSEFMPIHCGKWDRRAAVIPFDIQRMNLCVLRLICQLLSATHRTATAFRQ